MPAEAPDGEQRPCSRQVWSRRFRRPAEIDPAQPCEWVICGRYLEVKAGRTEDCGHPAHRPHGLVIFRCDRLMYDPACLWRPRRV
jgi:hypothetical protein